MISQLGRYEIIGELGQGAMGIVYKAKDPLIDRILAIKTISLNLAMDEKDEYEARFYQEAKAAGRLSHPNIVTVYDVGKSGDIAYIAMEFLEGRELRDVLNEGPRLPVDQVLDIVMQVALGLAYAHEHGIVHRDVKPSNIMVIRDGHVKITDFGIARMASSTVQTQAGVVLGSPKYMSPEQVLGKSIDQRSDIFSLGVMLYEMLAGQAPFVGDTINAVMYQTMNTVPAPPSALNSEVPAMLDFIITKALAKELDHRYQNAKEFADDLRACRGALPRPGAKAEATKSQSAASGAHLLGAIPVARQIEADAEETQPVANMGLSNNFDSFGATMRLAAMTAPGDAEEVGKTLKLTRPINQAAPQVAKPKIAASAATTTKRTIPVQASKGKGTVPKPANNNKLLLIMIVLLVLLGLAFIF
jgi:serine/threonine-protein kinase